MEETNTCFLCMGPIKYRVLTPCDHNSLCLSCYMRNTICYHHENCYYCQNPLKGYPIVSTDPQLTKYAEAKAKHPVFDSQYKLFFTDKENTRNYIASLFHFTCPECSLRLPAFDIFASHVKIHKMRVCQICYASNRFLPGDTHVFHSNKEYQTHVKTQHPRCMLCPNQIFFDHDELTKHMLEHHHRCDVCASQNKILWFKDAASLIEHMEKCHFVCPNCSSEKPVSFATRGELLMHLKTMHGQKLPPIDLADFSATPSSNDIKDDKNEDDVESNNREVVERRRELNRKFMTRLNEILNERDKTELMKVARNYVANKVTGEFFYNEYARYLGRNKDALFNEMVSFLPIPDKRLELIRIHVGYNSSNLQEQQNQNEQQDQYNQQNLSQQQTNQNLQQNRNNEKRNKNKKQYNKNQKKNFNHNQNQRQQNQNNQNQNQRQQNQNQHQFNHNQRQSQNQSAQNQSQNNANNQIIPNQIQTQSNQISTHPNQVQIQKKASSNLNITVKNQQNQIEIQKQSQQPKIQVNISINRSKKPSIVFEKPNPKEDENEKIDKPAPIQAVPQ